MVQKQIRREYVAAVEAKLKQHPLAMYPHYKDHMPLELFDKVVSVLGPDMCVNHTSALPTPTGNHAEEENCTELSKEDVGRTKHNKICPVVQSSTPRNPYILQMNGNGIKKGQTSKVNPQSTHKNMKVVTKLFSKWFAFPDEEKNVTESAILGNADSHLQDSSTTFPIQEEDFSFSGHKHVTTTNRQDLDFESL
ncbi:hypothetical protein D5F01_LYC09329 [Larimichthys crocea]|uniref:Uncharacterized protein n=1 Tax=Larimichthys crocea TaxID=215358 RepID=A0A6G0IL75_LARCR|nr:hypothetical protein D5F01_LYC09329 [Larimichthys crocea]